MGSPVLGIWRRRGNRLAALILAIVIGGGGVLYWYLGTEATDAGRTARAPGRPAVPVSVAIAARRDVPIYLIGLGAVQPTLSVGIHSQVDGKLQEVLHGRTAHQEGRRDRQD
jgi:multidrug efflux system membrane fusion protein